MTRRPQLLLLLLGASLAAWASDAAPEDAALLQVSGGHHVAVEEHQKPNAANVIADIVKLADPDAKTMTVHAVITMPGDTSNKPATPAPTPAPTPASDVTPTTPCSATTPCSGIYNFSDWGVRSYDNPFNARKPGEVGDDRWKLVRRVHRGYGGGDKSLLANLKGDRRNPEDPNMGYWHPATDNMAGTDVYGEYDGDWLSDSSFSMKFDDLDCEEFMFAVFSGSKTVNCNAYGFKYRAHCISIQAFFRIRKDELLGADGQKQYSYSDGFTTPFISSNNCCGKDPDTCHPYPTRNTGCKARVKRDLSDDTTPWLSDDAQHSVADYAEGSKAQNGLFVRSESQGANVFCLYERSKRAVDRGVYAR